MENHKGETCPYKPITCQENYCSDCWIFESNVPAEEAILARQATDDDVAEQIEDLLIY